MVLVPGTNKNTYGPGPYGPELGTKNGEGVGGHRGEGQWYCEQCCEFIDDLALLMNSGPPKVPKPKVQNRGPFKGINRGPFKGINRGII